MARVALSSSDLERRRNVDMVINERRYLSATFHSRIKCLGDIYYSG